MSRLFFFIAAAAALRADSLEEILKRMDTSAKTFQSFSANIKEISYVEVLKESTTENGVMRLKRTKKGLVGIVEFAPPDQRTYHFDGGKAEIYRPKVKIKEVYDLSKYKGTLDRALTIGFGTSGAELRSDYTIKVVGPETIQEIPTTHLQLTPKSAEIQKLITTVDLWIQEGKSYPVQDKILQPSKEYSIFIYSDVKINPPLPNSAFELKVPSDVKEVHPQK